MNNVEILEMQLKKIKNFCKDNKHYYPEELPYYMFWNCKQAEIVENLIQENKELKEVLEKVSKDLDNIAYDQIPIEMQRAFGKEYDLGYRQGWYNAEEDWKLKVKEKIEYYKKIDNSVGIMVLEKFLKEGE